MPFNLFTTGPGSDEVGCGSGMWMFLAIAGPRGAVVCTEYSRTLMTVARLVLGPHQRILAPYEHYLFVIYLKLPTFPAGISIALIGFFTTFLQRPTSPSTRLLLDVKVPGYLLLAFNRLL